MAIEDQLADLTAQVSALAVTATNIVNRTQGAADLADSATAAISAAATAVAANKAASDADAVATAADRTAVHSDAVAASTAAATATANMNNAAAFATAAAAAQAQAQTVANNSAASATAAAAAQAATQTIANNAAATATLAASTLVDINTAAAAVASDKTAAHNDRVAADADAAATAADRTAVASDKTAAHNDRVAADADAASTAADRAAVSADKDAAHADRVAADTAASTATTQAGIATAEADASTQQAIIATQQAAIATGQATTATQQAAQAATSNAAAGSARYGAVLFECGDGGLQQRERAAFERVGLRCYRAAGGGEPDNGQPREIPDPAWIDPQDGSAAPLIDNPEWAALPRTVEAVDFDGHPQTAPEPRWQAYDAAEATIAAASAVTQALAVWRAGEPDPNDAPAHDAWVACRDSSLAAIATEAAKSLPSDPRPVPDEISRRQFAMSCATLGLMTPTEVDAFLSTNDLPQMLLDAVDKMPLPYRNPTKWSIMGSTTFRSTHPATISLMNLVTVPQPYTSSQQLRDAIWRLGATFP